ncbi:hypothetical protein GIB67_034194 [Kingdonia uniflora]|uniref:TIR domain-containing protein n=1 Tax=Kingdonia uniflora TaxID=39325 RepID=A0A7J7NS51_9MAGN|nr:hypothetical protein GIB67_034194 [Kingdonia uniflora]
MEFISTCVVSSRKDTSVFVSIDGECARLGNEDSPSRVLGDSGSGTEGRKPESIVDSSLMESASAVLSSKFASVSVSIDGECSMSGNENNPSRYFCDSSSSSPEIREVESPDDVPLVPMSSGISLSDLNKQVVGIENARVSEISDDNLYAFNYEELKREKVDNVEEYLVSPSIPSTARLRSCDVYIGLPNYSPNLIRFGKWLRAELELHGISCFAVDRSRCKDALGQSGIERAMSSAAYGVVVVAKESLWTPHSMHELKSFMGKKNLVPIFYELGPRDCIVRDIIGMQGDLWETYGGKLWNSYGGVKEEWKETVNALSRMTGWKLQASSINMRECISEATFLLGTRLGKRNVVERVKEWKKRVNREEFPFPRNDKFIGRKKELLELELMLFGEDNVDEKTDSFELKNPRQRNNSAQGIVRNMRNHINSKSKGKTPMEIKESDKEIEFEGSGYLRRQRRKEKSREAAYGKGVACVFGEHGIGKTELLLEFAYKSSQRYKMVLWVGGEARYMRQSYLNFLPLLEVDVSMENQLCFERKKPRSSKEVEEEAIQRLRKELMRDIPFLIVIDNLETEKDWWDGRNIMELLPHFGGETHVVISTRLHKVMNLEPLWLCCLPGTEAMSLMRKRLEDIPVEEADALRIIEEKLGRHTFGLALVRGILSELSIGPQVLLDSIKEFPLRDFTWSREEDKLLRQNTFLLQLIEVCFSLLSCVDEVASRITLASGWFAPSAIPVSLLALASSEALKRQRRGHCWKTILGALICREPMFRKKRSNEESSAMLVRLGFARNATKHGCIHFHEIIQLYARKVGDSEVPHAMVRSIVIRGHHHQHNEHIWASCFVLFSFGRDQSILKPNASEMVSFINQVALPLAMHAFTYFSRCGAALELLRLCTHALDIAEEPFLLEADKGLENSTCWGGLSLFSPLSPVLYQELALLKSSLLETRSKLMLQGGDYDIGEELCRSAIRIREVICGHNHPKTTSLYNILRKLVRSQENCLES